MLQVFADAGLRLHRALADGAYEISFPLPTSKTTPALTRTVTRLPNGSGRAAKRAGSAG